MAMKEYLRSPKAPRLETHQPDCFISYPRHPLGGVLTPLQRWSWCILQPQLTGWTSKVSDLNDISWLIFLHSYHTPCQLSLLHVYYARFCSYKKINFLTVFSYSYFVSHKRWNLSLWHYGTTIATASVTFLRKNSVQTDIHHRNYLLLEIMRLSWQRLKTDYVQYFLMVWCSRKLFIEIPQSSNLHLYCVCKSIEKPWK